MEISVKFSQEELILIWQALNLGAIHTPDDVHAKEMNDLGKKIEMISMLNVNKK